MVRVFAVVFLVTFQFVSFSQTNYNELTQEEYHTIKFNNVRLLELITFQGQLKDISNLFGIQFSEVAHELNDEGKEFDSNVISISFFEDQLGGIELKGNVVNVTIGNNTFSIGDNASILGYGSDAFNYFLNPKDAQIGIAIFKPMLNNTYVYIRFNKDSGIIEEIGFRSPT